MPHSELVDLVPVDLTENNASSGEYLGAHRVYPHWRAVERTSGGSTHCMASIQEKALVQAVRHILCLGCRAPLLGEQTVAMV